MNLDVLSEKQRFYQENLPLILSEVLAKMQFDFRVVSTYNSMALSGNSLTLAETEFLLKHGVEAFLDMQKKGFLYR